MTANQPSQYAQSLKQAVQLNHTPHLVSFYGHTMDCFDMAMHAHPQLEIMYIVTGSCRIPLQTGEVILREGDFIYLDAYTPHRLIIEPEHPCRIYMLEILCQPSGSGPRLGDLAASCPQLAVFTRLGHPQITLHDSGDLYPIISQLQQERENHADRQDHGWKLSALFTCLFIELTRCAEQASQRLGYGHVRQAMAFIHGHYDQPLPVERIAQAAGIHPAHLQRLFQIHRRQTVGDYISQLRMEKACMLLLNSNLPIVDIAISAGYNSRQNFGLAFRKMFQLSPGEYRRRKGNQAILPGERESMAGDLYQTVSER